MQVPVSAQDLSTYLFIYFVFLSFHELILRGLREDRLDTVPLGLP